MGTEDGRPPVGVRLVLKGCIREEVGDQGGELVDPPRLEGMVCCCDGELKKPRESERGGWLAARSLRGMWVRMGWSGIRNRFLRSEGTVVGHYSSTASCVPDQQLYARLFSNFAARVLTRRVAQNSRAFRAVRATEQWYSTVESR